jgi:hypothetical protein
LEYKGFTLIGRAIQRDTFSMNGQNGMVNGSILGLDFGSWIERLREITGIIKKRLFKLRISEKL